MKKENKKLRNLLKILRPEIALSFLHGKSRLELRAMTERCKGYLLTETMIALGILGTIMIIMALGLKTYGNFNHYQYARQQCIAAGQAQLDSLSAIGKPISEKESTRLWPKVQIRMEQSDGTGQWQGLTLIKVKTSTKSYHRDVNIEMGRYIALKKEKQK